jgi:hypothetical protein
MDSTLIFLTGPLESGSYPKAMKKLSLLFFLFILFNSCSKDNSTSSNNCLFVGGTWCDNLNIQCLEFRSDGTHYFNNAYIYKWVDKDNCSKIELNNIAFGNKQLEYFVISITGNSLGSKMVLDQTGIQFTYTKTKL